MRRPLKRASVPRKKPWRQGAIRPPEERKAKKPPQASGVASLMKQMIAIGRVGAPEEAAGAMLLLASPYASYVTGQSLEVTGGGWL